MVIALDKKKRPLGFIIEKRARKLMEKKRAVIYRYFPCVVIIKDIDARSLDDIPTFRIKIDPGSKTTGIAVVGNDDNKVYFYAQIEHRGSQIKQALETKNHTRRNRRTREVRHRRNKYWCFTKGKMNSGKREDKEGWLPPSVKSPADNVIHFVEKLMRFLPITECSFEAVRFDTQKMDNPEISGAEYQHGTLHGYEMKEYLLETYGHTCQYCGGKSGDKILEWEHMIPKSRGGSDSVKNAILACHKCNQDKDDRTLKEYYAVLQKRYQAEQKKKEKKKSKTQAAKTEDKKEKKKSLTKVRMEYIKKVLDGHPIGASQRYAAWVNSTRKYIETALFSMFDDVECSSGGKTKYNRIKLGIPKDHHYDALCVGTVPKEGYQDLTGGYVLYVTAMGRGTRCRNKHNACGVITQKLAPRPKRVFGFQNGDIVKAVKERGQSAGTYIGRLTVRARGYFALRSTEGKKIEMSHDKCTLLQHEDGYQYCYRKGQIPLGN